MTGYDDEPIPGLPGRLPTGERILWQGAPAWRTLARDAFHVRLVTGYFALLAGWGAAGALAEGGGFRGVVSTIAIGALGVALLHLIAWASARTTLYTLTDRRIVLRIGIAVPKCVNLPLGLVGAIDVAMHADGTGDVPLRVMGRATLGMLALWPHARPWRIARPQPMLRAVPDAQAVAAMIARACSAVTQQAPAPASVRASAPAPAFTDAVAA